jgi:nicotinamide riboside transporter PnuC
MNWWLAESLGWIVTVIAVAGVLLNNARRLECFYLWFVSNGISMMLHLFATMYALAARDAIFLVLAILGLRAWSKELAKDGQSAKG